MMKTMSRVSIALPPRPYDAVIENGLLQRSGETLRDLFSVIFNGGRGRLASEASTPVRGHRPACPPQVGQKADGFSVRRRIHREDRGNARWRTPQKAGHGREVVPSN